MSHNFGQLFGADQAFDACIGGGMTIAQYCNRPPSDICCGICNNIPITGFGTFLGILLGTLFNLIIALYWKVETPYSLAFQFLGADGMVLSLAVQFYNSRSGTSPLSLFHYCFVPLSALSPIPILAATSVAQLEYLGRDRAQSEPIVPTKKTDDTASLDSVKTHDTLRDNLPNPFLPRLALWVTFGHLVVYLGVFLTVFAGLKETAQSNCIEELRLNQWRLGMAVWCFSFLIFVGFGFWWVLYLALSSEHRLRTRHFDGLQIVIYAFLRVFSISTWGKRKPAEVEGRLMQTLTSSTTTNVWRYGLSGTIYLFWAVPYAAIYFAALNNFILFGTNPMPYEQVSAAVGIISPIVVAARTWMENRDGWNDKRRKRDALQVDALKEKDDSLHEDIVRLSSSGSGGVGPSGHEKHPHAHHSHGDNGGEGSSGVRRTVSARKASDGGYFKHDPTASGFPPAPPDGHPMEQRFPHRDPSPHQSSRHSRYDDLNDFSPTVEEGDEAEHPPSRHGSQHTASGRRRSLASLANAYAPAQTWLDLPENASEKARGKRPIRQEQKD
ncbi:hypothetical protein JCM11251_004369 [Rhodosporidiobolus azoricus]